MTPETQQFISEHTNDDVQKLALQADKFKHIDMSFALRQIKGRQKIKNKVPLFYQNEDIIYPMQLSIEQSSSELTARYKASLIKGNSFIDLTGGFGIDCYFLSQNFTNAIYVERIKELCEIATQNFKSLGVDNIQVVNNNCEDYLSSVSISNTDVIYIDPARRGLSGNKVFFLADCEPNVVGLTENLLQKAGKVLIKTSPMLDISSTLKDLPSINEIHIISVENECKELVLILNKKIDEDIRIKTINIQKNCNQLFDFYQKEDSQAIPEYCTSLKKYLYEPNNSIMKSGAFNIIATRFDLLKLHKNTHLYTSDKLITDFPGRIFQINSVSGSTKQALKQLKLQVSKANITVRNFPISVIELRKKSGISDGGDIYIFACKMENELNILIICSKAV